MDKDKVKTIFYLRRQPRIFNKEIKVLIKTLIDTVKTVASGVFLLLLQIQFMQKGEDQMTEFEKQQIQELRLKGVGYKTIAAVIGISSVFGNYKSKRSEL